MQQKNKTELRLGDEGALWAFGSDAQALLGVASRTIASATALETENRSLFLIGQTIEALDSISEPPKRRLFGLLRERHSNLDKPEALQKQIRDLAVTLQLRSAQLARETSLLKSAEQDLQDCCTQLEDCLQSGNRFLAENASRNDPDEQGWRGRFERRLEELQLTKTIALQSLAQAQLLRSTKEDLMQKLQSINNVVIPLWRTHASALWGMQAMKSEALEKQKIEKTITEELARNRKRAAAIVESLHGSENVRSDDIDALLHSCHELCESLKAIAAAERKCSLLEAGADREVPGKE